MSVKYSRLTLVFLAPVMGALAASACGSDDGGTGSRGSGGADASAGGAEGGTGGAGAASVGGASAAGGSGASGGSAGASGGGSGGQGGGAPDASASCGNGIVDPGEECDTAIGAGETGACPTSCSTTATCRESTLSGADCTARCVEAAITISRDGDGCCPASANANTDDDCTPECGNGAVENGEVCDTDIASGAGSCATSATCDDAVACTIDGVTNAGTCTAACDFSQLATADLSATDGCCPQGANDSTDADCNPLCGNGVLDANETCDTAIASGTGACPTSCPDDGDGCTVESLNVDDPCNPTCATTTITSPANGDGCCPTGGAANSRNDDDCVPTAFRLTSLTLAEPHLIVNNTCDDITSAVNSGVIAPEFEDDAGGLADGGPDGYYDLSFVAVADPLSQSDPSTYRLYTDALCTFPVGDAGPSSSVCGPGASSPQSGLYDNQSSGTCLGPVAGTTHPWVPPVISSTAGPDGCFATRESDLIVNLAGLTFPFQRAQFAGQWVDDPATGVIEGLIKGFLTKSVADTLIITVDLGTGPVQIPFGMLVVGGAGNACADGSQSDMDTITAGDGGIIEGWWFYLNFEAVRVDWSG